MRPLTASRLRLCGHRRPIWAAPDSGAASHSLHLAVIWLLVGTAISTTGITLWSASMSLL